jgi:glycerophosphoryl diester phosphodiesterase
MLVIAHRGNNKEVLENSYQAFELAVACGAKRIELDVQLTKDHVAVINHDDSLLHTTKKPVRCSELTFSELQKVTLLDQTPVPTLAEVIERFLPKIELNIEIKGNGTLAAARAWDILKNNPLRDRVIFSSFHLDPLLYLRDHASEIRRACLIGDDETHWPQLAHKSALIFMQEANATILHPRYDQVSEHLMDQARSRGWQVFSWATMVGEDHRMHEVWTTLKSFDVDGHCTNYPREMVQWLQDLEKLERTFYERTQRI